MNMTNTKPFTNQLNYYEVAIICCGLLTSNVFVWLWNFCCMPHEPNSTRIQGLIMYSILSTICDHITHKRCSCLRSFILLPQWAIVPCIHYVYGILFLNLFTSLISFCLDCTWYHGAILYGLYSILLIIGVGIHKWFFMHRLVPWMN